MPSVIVRSGKSPIVRQSIRERIEAQPRVGKTELAGIKVRAPRQILFRSRKREKDFVEVGVPNSGSWSLIHTHTPRFLDRLLSRAASLPSIGDYLALTEAIKSNPKHFSHIASVTEKGSLLGYFSFRLGKEFRAVNPETRSKAAARMTAILGSQLRTGGRMDRVAAFLMSGRIKRTVLSALLSERLIQVYAQPMPGYRFDPKKGDFFPAKSQ